MDSLLLMARGWGVGVGIRTSRKTAMVLSTDTGTSTAMISTLHLLEMFTRVDIIVENI